MRILYYNTNSFGGCFNYSLEIYEYLYKHKDIKRIRILFPRNSVVNGADFIPILLPDVVQYKTKLSRKLYFLWRSLINPLRFLIYARKHKYNILVFNDFDQITSFFYVPLFKIFKPKKAIIAAILHDPDRDNYLKSKFWSRLTMKIFMKLPDIAFYHELLPNRCYYTKNKKCEYVSIPHGLYFKEGFDTQMWNKLQEIKNKKLDILSIIGNIRTEKNYETAIKALKYLPDNALVIAGKPANKQIDTKKYKQLAAQEGVEDRVFFIERWLTNDELNSIIEQSSIILMAYAESFKSQSGILNNVAPFRKNIIVSDTESSLSAVCKRFGIGLTVKPDDVNELVNAIRKIYEGYDFTEAWIEYIKYANWETNVQIQVDSFKKKLKNEDNIGSRRQTTLISYQQVYAGLRCAR